MGFTDVEDIPAIVAGLREAYTSGSTRPLEWRRRQLKAMQRMLLENEEAMLDALKKDLHRSRFVGLALELWDVVAQVAYLLNNLEKFTKPDSLKTPLTLKPVSFEAWKEPFGVVTIIAPWNFPFALGLNPLAGALAAGNACVFKPSEVSVASNQLLEELIPKYFEPSAVALVSGGVEQTTELLAQKVDNIMYTGGAVVGRIVMAAAAKNLTPVTLELGGKCPAYVDESANLEVTARRLLFAKNINAGQICIAPDYVLVHHKVRDSLVEHLKTQHAKLFPGAEQESDDKGRIISDNHFLRVKGLLQDHGGKVVFGGEMDDADRFMAFTIVTDPSPDCPLMQEEIFGPILPVVTVQSIEEAIVFTGQRPTPLAAYVFERDPAVSKKWLAEVASGGACVNDCMMQLANNEGGFGGKGESGMGAYRGRSSFDSFTHRKIVARQAPNFDPRAKYPPYSGVPPFLKMLVTQQFPAWVKPVFQAAVFAAVAGLVMLAHNHVSVSLRVTLR